MVLSARADGQFVVEARVNGQPVRFMVDTGASDLMLSPADAARLGFDLDTLAYTHPYQTANGRVYGAPVRLGEVAVGPIVLRNVKASVNGAPLDHSLLGMSFLGRLGGFSVDGSRLTLRK